MREYNFASSWLGKPAYSTQVSRIRKSLASSSRLLQASLLDDREQRRWIRHKPSTSSRCSSLRHSLSQFYTPPNMKSLLLCAIITFASAQQNIKNPVKDFCRRHSHQTCIIDSKLFIDGGMVYYNDHGDSCDNETKLTQSECPCLGKIKSNRCRPGSHLGRRQRHKQSQELSRPICKSL